MNTLRQFSDKERDYHAYQARQNYLREQRCIQIEMDEIRVELEQTQGELEQTQQELDKERMEKRLAVQREQSAQAEIERLKALLAQTK